MDRCKCGHARDDHFAKKTAAVGEHHELRVVAWGKCGIHGCDCPEYTHAEEHGGAPQP